MWALSMSSLSEQFPWPLQPPHVQFPENSSNSIPSEFGGRFHYVTGETIGPVFYLTFNFSSLPRCWELTPSLLITRWILQPPLCGLQGPSEKQLISISSGGSHWACTDLERLPFPLGAIKQLRNYSRHQRQRDKYCNKRCSCCSSHLGNGKGEVGGSQEP